MGLIYLYHVRNRQWFISRYFPDIGLDRLTFIYLFIHSFIHSIGMRRMRRFLAVLRSFFHSSLLCTFSCHPSLPTILPISLTSSCHLFLGLPLNLVVPKYIYNTLLGIIFSFILCTFPNQRNLFNLIVSIRAGFLTLEQISLLVNILQFSFSLSYTGPKNSSIHFPFKNVQLLSISLC